jgi:hypothetical protein
VQDYCASLAALPGIPLDMQPHRSPSVAAVPGTTSGNAEGGVSGWLVPDGVVGGAYREGMYAPALMGALRGGTDVGALGERPSATFAAGAAAVGGSGSSSDGLDGASRGLSATERSASKPTEFVVRLLIPEHSAGAILGRNGATIRATCDDTGATIRLSPADRRWQGPASHGQERLVSVAGGMDSVAAALDAVFMALVADPRK